MGSVKNYRAVVTNNRIAIHQKLFRLALTNPPPMTDEIRFLRSETDSKFGQ